MHILFRYFSLLQKQQLISHFIAYSVKNIIRTYLKFGSNYHSDVPRN